MSSEGRRTARRTDHSKQIAAMRELGAAMATSQRVQFQDHAVMLLAAADILELHDDTSLSLDNFGEVRRMVLRALTMAGAPAVITSNGA